MAADDETYGDVTPEFLLSEFDRGLPTMTLQMIAEPKANSVSLPVAS
jgi:hypothetical protein